MYRHFQSSFLSATIFSVYHCILIFKVAKCELIVGSSNENTLQSFSCNISPNVDSTQYPSELSHLNCTITFSYSLAKANVSDCIQLDNRVYISVEMAEVEYVSLTNVTFLCITNVHLSVKVYSKSKDSEIEYIMKPEDIVNNPAIQDVMLEYKVKLLFPKYPSFFFFPGDVINYTIQDVQRSFELNVDVAFLQPNGSLFVPSKNLPQSQFNVMLGNTEQTNDSLNLYCFQFNQVLNIREIVYLFKINETLNRNNYKTPEIFGHFAYLIMAELENFIDSLHWTIRLPLLRIIPNYKNVALSYMQGIMKIVGVDLPILNDTWEHFPVRLHDKKDMLVMECNIQPQFWNVIVYSQDYGVPFYYSRKYNIFILELNLPTNNTIDDTDKSLPILHHWPCENVLQCQMVVSLCVYPKEVIEDNFLDFISGSGIPMERIEEICNEKSEQSEALSETCNNKGFELKGNTTFCQTIRPDKKGVVLYNSSAELTSDKIYYLYFVGFDNETYVDIDMTNKTFPLNATLKLTPFNHLKDDQRFWTDDWFRFRCEAHSFWYADDIHWYLKYENGTEKDLQKNSGYIRYNDTEHQDKYNPESNVHLSINDTKLVQVICSVKLIYEYERKNISMNITVLDQVGPTILPTDDVLYLKGPNQIMVCNASGVPTPEVIWTKEGKEILIDGGPDNLTILEQRINFPYYDSKFLGEYTCTASNKAGSVSKVFTVKEDEDRSAMWLTYTLSAVGTSTILIVAIIIFISIRIQREKQRKQMEEIIRLVEGKESKDEKNNIEDGDPLTLPFQKSYEIKKEDFTINWNRPLGSGEFGEVYQGTLKEVEGPVAVKMLKKNAKIEHLKALASELKILMFVGVHDNLVALLGAYKHQLEQGILYLTVEFCAFGSLQSYIQTNKHHFLKCPQLRSLVGERVLNKNVSGSMSEPFTSFHSLATLLKWCKQITCGMEYLGSKYVVHADLASRNVLLTSEGTAKVTDFGLSRRMYNYTEYVKTSYEPLPWQWIAPETILLKKFSSKSDVWAYGITMWEIFTFGQKPYPTFEFNEEFLEMLQSGRRNKQPKYAPNEIFEYMKKCWEYNPDKRPTFSSLKCGLTELVENLHQFNQINVPVEVDEHQCQNSAEPYFNKMPKNNQYLQISLPLPVNISEYTKLADVQLSRL